MLPRGRCTTCVIYRRTCFLGLICTIADPAQHLITAGQDLDDLPGDLSDLSVRSVKCLVSKTANAYRSTARTMDAFPGLDLYHTHPAQHLVTARWDLDDDLDRDLSVRRGKCNPIHRGTICCGKYFLRWICTIHILHSIT